MSAPSDSAVEVEVTSDVAPDVPAKRAYTRLAPHQFDFVAMAMENGVPSDEIARAVDCDPSYIDHLGKRTNESFNRVRDAYRKQILGETVAWRFKLAKLLPLGYTAIENALQGKDAKLACEQAWRVLEAVVPESRPAATVGGPAVQVNFGANTQVQAQLASTLENVFASFNTLKQSMALDGPDPHVRQGSDAIIQLGIPDKEAAADAPLVGARFNGNGSGTEGTGTVSSVGERTLGEPAGDA